MIDLFAGLRPVGEGGVRLRLRQVDRVGFAGDEADETFVGGEHGVVHGLAFRPSVA